MEIKNCSIYPRYEESLPKISRIPEFALFMYHRHGKSNRVKCLPHSNGQALILQLSFHFRCMWEYTIPAHELPIGDFFRGESAQKAYRRKEDYSATKGNSTVVLTACPVSPAWNRQNRLADRSITGQHGADQQFQDRDGTAPWDRGDHFRDPQAE